ncbi:precorrin-6A synthase (deacetylating) [Granulicella tundricola]|uniref:Precorrin-6A synthase (Deacetylating) n=1 Tax=Granulicella tundricola (strain ATCC BAA-1859 / DSM 23138 / MP5ACTX9) TaxID=1198114 RepID=E8X6S8_GRATM|nr:precorrin-6A synthase (deacetylating) [Granulicella tundricola]ADW71228.1 precorrin-6A synthase (deacetylating) [Granulicella tundricola MP5ACTX9]
MRHLFIIGIGAGHPDYITIQAVKALNLVDIFFFMNKGDSKDELVRLRKDICERYIEHHPYRIVESVDPIRDESIPDYKTRVQQWHLERVQIYEDLIANELSEDATGAFLIWGDPSLYDSTLRIIDQIVARANVPFTYDVIPGITSPQALAARHRIPLHDIGESILITTGRHLASGKPIEPENILVMLDGHAAYKDIPDQQTQIYWGAYLGMENEILLSGTLEETAPKIEAARAEARERNGWIMDTYLLSKPAN